MCFGPLFDAAVVVVAQSRSGLKVCLDRLIDAVGYAEQHGIRAFISVLDNNSDDAVADLLEGYHDSVYWGRTSRKLGYAQARNWALRRAQREGWPFVVFIDPHARTPPGLIADLVAFMRRNEAVGLAEPRQLHCGGDEEPEAVGWSSPGGTEGDNLICTGQDQSETLELTDSAAAPDAIERAALRGAVFIARTDVMDAVGRFDETYSSQLALDDLCRRAQLDRWRVVSAPALTAECEQSPPGPGSGLGPLNEVLFYCACEPDTGWRQMARLACTYVMAGLIVSRRDPVGLVAGLARFAVAAAKVACRWHRVIASRRVARRLTEGPTWKGTTSLGNADGSQRR